MNLALHDLATEVSPYSITVRIALNCINVFGATGKQGVGWNISKSIKEMWKHLVFLVDPMVNNGEEPGSSLQSVRTAGLYKK